MLGYSGEPSIGEKNHITCVVCVYVSVCVNIITIMILISALNLINRVFKNQEG